MPLVKHGGVSSWDDLTDKPSDFTPSAHALDAHTAVTLAELNAKISDADLGPAYTLPTASATVLGGVKVGANLTVREDGTVDAEAGGGGGGSGVGDKLYLYQRIGGAL